MIDVCMRQPNRRQVQAPLLHLGQDGVQIATWVNDHGLLGLVAPQYGAVLLKGRHGDGEVMQHDKLLSFTVSSPTGGDAEVTNKLELDRTDLWTKSLPPTGTVGLDGQRIHPLCDKRDNRPERLRDPLFVRTFASPPICMTTLPASPACPDLPPPPFTERQLRNALGQFATGVTIVTTADAQGQPVGMTVSSFSSVSLAPALVLWCLGRATALRPTFERSQHYAIHVLALDQLDLALRFSSKMANRFEHVDWQPNAQGVPILAGAAAVFECVLRNRYDGGDHMIMLGQVMQCRHQPAAPLLYHGGHLGLQLAPQPT